MPESPVVENAVSTHVAAQTAGKPRNRAVEYGVVLVIVGILIAAAFFQEDISSYLRLRMWDSGAPGRIVLQFLEAGKRGDKGTTDKLLAATGYGTVNKDGKWLGYSVTAMPGTMQFLWNDLCPADPRVLSTDFTRLGKGSAVVTVPDAKGKPSKYRLEMTDDGWKITDILGGRPLPR